MGMSKWLCHGRWWLILWTFLPLMGVVAGETEPPERVMFEAPRVGTQTVWRLVDQSGERSVTHTVLDDVSDFDGRPVFRESNGRVTQVFNAVNNNWIATLDNRGEVTLSAEPDTGTYNWPLWVGKQWLASYRYTDHEQQKSINPVVRNWKVVAYESVTVPAGTFDAFVIEGTPVSDQSWKRSLWFVPQLGTHVRHVQQRAEQTAVAELILITRP